MVAFFGFPLHAGGLRGVFPGHHPSQDLDQPLFPPQPPFTEALEPPSIWLRPLPSEVSRFPGSLASRETGKLQPCLEAARGVFLRRYFIRFNTILGGSVGQTNLAGTASSFSPCAGHTRGFQCVQGAVCGIPPDPFAPQGFDDLGS